MKRALLGCALVAAAASVAAAPASGGAAAEKRATKVVSVADDYFTPAELKLAENSKVKWVWSDSNTNTHNVVLTNKHPDKVEKGDFRSSSGAVGLVFKRKFEVPGGYGFICTYHREVMKFDLKVKRR